MKKLHEKYGPIVRIGPNLLDLDFPELYRVIYSTDGKWVKSDFYKNSSSIINGKITYHMFSETDNVEHARLKRPVVRHYSVPAVLAMEPHMDKVIADFLQHLQKRFVEPKKACDFGNWLSYCTSSFLSFAVVIGWFVSTDTSPPTHRCVGFSGHRDLFIQVRLHGEGLRLRRHACYR